jgi:hypothetical protein
MDASPGSQSRKGMGFRSWYCGSCGTGGNRPAVYFSGEPFFFPYPNHPLSIYRGLNMWRHVILVCMSAWLLFVLASLIVPVDDHCQLAPSIKKSSFRRTRIFRKSVLGEKPAMPNVSRLYLMHYGDTRYPRKADDL